MLNSNKCCTTCHLPCSITSVSIGINIQHFPLKSSHVRFGEGLTGCDFGWIRRFSVSSSCSVDGDWNCVDICMLFVANKSHKNYNKTGKPYISECDISEINNRYELVLILISISIKKNYKSGNYTGWYCMWEIMYVR